MVEARTVNVGKHRDAPWRPLLHRWFVEYNPGFLLSAALVLAGILLLFQGIAEDDSLFGRLGVTAIAEVYSVALIGGAALLVRIQHRRSAVMVAVMAMCFQGDLTLHTDTAPDLGLAGVMVSAAWLSVFVAKLSAVAWVMKLRLCRSTFAAAILGAAGLTVLPFLLSRVGPGAGAAIVLLWLFSLSQLQSRSAITSRDPLDQWGQTVLRRAVRVTWAFFALQLSFHLWFWAKQGHVRLVLLVPLALLFTTCWVETERQLWGLLTITLLVTGLAIPSLLSATALATTALLALRAVSCWRANRSSSHDDPSAGPYRSGHHPVDGPPVDWVAPASRYFLGAALSLYLSLWTLTWHAGPFPAHLLPLDLVFTAAAAAVLWRARYFPTIAPLAGLWCHFVWQTRLIPAPRTIQQWGGTAIGLGFAMLGASLATSYLLRGRLTHHDRDCASGRAS